MSDNPSCVPSDSLAILSQQELYAAVFSVFGEWIERISQLEKELGIIDKHGECEPCDKQWLRSRVILMSSMTTELATKCRLHAAIRELAPKMTGQTPWPCLAKVLGLPQV